MLTALYRCGFRIEYEGDRHHIATPSHACHGHIFPDHVLEEEVGYRSWTFPIGCALGRHAYAHAYHVLKALPSEKRWLDDHPARDACDAGRCDEFHRHFALPSLARGKGLIGKSVWSALSFMCKHAKAYFERIILLFDPREDAGLWSRAIDLFIHGTNTEEGAEMLLLCHLNGTPHRIAHSTNQDLLSRADALLAEHVANIIDRVAAHLPVEGVPELVTQYVCGKDSHPYQYLSPQ